MLPYVIVYLTLLITFILGRKVSIKDQKILSYALIIIFTLLRGLRWKTGTDWDYYEDIFTNVDQYIKYDLNQVEIGFLYFNKLIKVLYDNYTFYLIVSNLLFLISYYKFCYYFFKSYPLEAFSICLICLDLFPVRQTFAVAIIIWVVPLMLQKKYIQSVFVILMAYFVHRTSLIMLLFLPPVIHNIKLSYLTRVISYICIFILSAKWGLEQLINSYVLPLLPSDGGAAYRALLYMNPNKNDHEIGITSIIITCIILFAVKILLKKNNSTLLLVSLNAYYLHQTIFVLFQDGVVAEFSRFASYFSWGYFILIIFIYKGINNRKIALTFICILFLYKFNSLFNSYNELLIPYYSIFDNYIPNRTF